MINPKPIPFQPRRDLPSPPKHLAAATRRWWSEVIGTYELESHHIRLLTAAAEAWDTMQAARRIVQKEGLTYVSKAGEPKRHPAVGIEQDSRIAFARLLRELALDVSTPADDSRPPQIGGR